MSNPEGTEVRQTIASGVNALLHQRLRQAVPVELLSDVDNKILEVIEELDGRRLVRRSFTQDAVRGVERGAQVGFEEAWEIMQSLFTGKNMRVVPSRLLQAEGQYPYVVISEYVEGGIPLREAPTQLKKDLAHNLGQLLQAPEGYMPKLDMIAHDMFQAVKREDGSCEVLMIDTDPYVMPRLPYRGHDTLDVAFIKRIAYLLWDEWATESERAEVVHVFVASAYRSLDEDADTGVFAALADMRDMAQGRDTRQSEFQWDFDN